MHTFWQLSWYELDDRADGGAMEITLPEEIAVQLHGFVQLLPENVNQFLPYLGGLALDFQRFEYDLEEY